MKYFVFVTKNQNDGTTKKSVYEFDSLNEAKASFHKSLGVDMANKDLLGGMAIVINSDGGVHMSEAWNAEQIAAVVEEVAEEA